MSSVQWLAKNLNLPDDEVLAMLEFSDHPAKAAANLVESLSSTGLLSVMRSRYARLDTSLDGKATIRDTLIVLADEPVPKQKDALRFVIRSLQEVRH